MEPTVSQSDPPPIPPAEPHAESAADWFAPVEESRLRAFLFKFLPILFLCAIAYGPAWRGTFLWQDDTQVTANNPLKSLTGLGLLWRAPTVTPQWAPLSYSLLWPQYFIWGDRTALGYHLVNLLLHSFNAMLFWILLKRLGLPGAFTAALIFALHPLQTETVGWIARQPELFGCFWGLCFAIVYLRFSGADATGYDPTRIPRLPERTWMLYALAVLFFAMALLSYPILVCTLPLVMGLIVWWKRESFTAGDLKPLLPLLAMSVTALAVNWIAERHHDTANWNLLGACASVWFYVAKFLRPTNLTPIYKVWDLGLRNPLPWLAATGLLALIAWMVAESRARRRGAVVGVAAYLLLLLPMIAPINRAEMTTSLVADHFVYLANAALAAGLVAVVIRLAWPLARGRSWVGPLASTALIAILFLAVWFGHSSSFASADALWDNAASEDSENIPVLIHRAQQYESKKETIPKAMDQYQRVLRLTNRHNVDALVALGKLFHDQNDTDTARNYFEEAVKVAPDHPSPYEQLGPLLAQEKQFDEASALYAEALRRFPRDAKLYLLLGKVQLQQHQPKQALESLEKAVALEPHDAEIHIEIGNYYASLGDLNHAILEISEALKIDPRNYDAYMDAGSMFVNALRMVGPSQHDQALNYAYNCFRSARVLKPSAPEPCSNLGIVLTIQSQGYWLKGQLPLAQQQIKEAIATFDMATQLDPTFTRATHNLAVALQMQKQIQSPPPVRPSTRPTTKPATAP